MLNLVKKHSISFELVQKMVAAVVAKAREIVALGRHPHACAYGGVGRRVSH
jgi:hypothetical protein